MKKIKIGYILFYFLIAPLAFLLAGNIEDSINEFDLLINLLERNAVEYNYDINDYIVNENDIDLSDYLVFDLRSEDDYNATPNPISQALNVSLNNIFVTIEDYYKTELIHKKILISCYSGQTAFFAHKILSLKGYKAYVMNFGMSWHDPSLDKWTTNCSDKNSCDLVRTTPPTLPIYDYPEINTGEKTAEAILEARIEAAIEAWGNGLLISADDVINNASMYNIVNYWPKADYQKLGHINGAYQVTPGSITTECNLRVFNPVGDNILYCYTGQTAAAEIAYLTVLGYDVKSIKFGFNNMNWSALSEHKWPKPWGESRS